MVPESGTVLAWGYNEYGQLGNHATLLGFPALYTGTYPFFDTAQWIWSDIYIHPWFDRTWIYPAKTDDQGLDHYQAYQVENMPFDQKDFQAVSGGKYHSLALAADGSLLAWGNNEFGQLGDGTQTERHIPVTVPLTNASAISAGLQHSVALKADGTVWTWGRNNYGQLGNDTTTDSLTPIQVAGLVDIVAVSAGDYHSLALSRDGGLWAWGFNADGELGDNSTTHRYTPVQTEGFKIPIFTGHAGDVLAVAYFTSGSSEYVVTGSADNTARLWNATTGALIRTFDDAFGGGTNAHTASVNSVDAYDDGTDWFIVTGSSDRTVKLWNGKTGDWIRDFDDTGASLATAHQGSVTSVVFSSDASQVLTASVDRTAKLWTTSTGVLVRKFIDATLTGINANRSHEASVNAAIFSGDDSQVFTGSADKTAKLWDPSDGSHDGTFIDGTLTAENLGKSHEGSITSLAYYTDGGATEQLVTGSADHRAKVWDVTTVTAPPSSPTTIDANFQSFDTDDYANGHRLDITSVDISSDGLKVVTGSRDNTAKRWVVSTGLVDVEATTGTIATFERHNDWINDVKFAEGDSTKILTGSSDDLAKFGQTPRVIRIDAGAFHNLAVKADSSAWSWGYNNNGQLGIGDRQTRALQRPSVETN